MSNEYDEYPHDSNHDEPNDHRPSREAWRALARIEKHEAVCAERYKHIENRLAGILEDTKSNRRLLLSVGALIIAALLAAFFDILLLGDERDVQFIYLDESGRMLERGNSSPSEMTPWGY